MGSLIKYTGAFRSPDGTGVAGTGLEVMQSQLASHLHPPFSTGIMHLSHLPEHDIREKVRPCIVAVASVMCMR